MVKSRVEFGRGTTSKEEGRLWMSLLLLVEGGRWKVEGGRKRLAVQSAVQPCERKLASSDHRPEHGFCLPSWLRPRRGLCLPPSHMTHGPGLPGCLQTLIGLSSDLYRQGSGFHQQGSPNFQTRLCPWRINSHIFCQHGSTILLVIY